MNGVEVTEEALKRIGRNVLLGLGLGLEGRVAKVGLLPHNKRRALKAVQVIHIFIDRFLSFKGFSMIKLFINCFSLSHTVMRSAHFMVWSLTSLNEKTSELVVGRIIRPRNCSIK